MDKCIIDYEDDNKGYSIGITHGRIILEGVKGAIFF